MPKKTGTLTPDQIRVVQWLATPHKERKLKTQAELARELGVRAATVSKWRKRLGLDAYAQEMVRDELLSYLPDVYRVLAEKASDGSFAHMKLFLQTAR